MSIEAICKRQVVTIDAGASLAEAARVMRNRHVGALVVTEQADGREHVVGVVTDRDLAVEVLARNLAPAGVRIGQLATHKLVAVRGSADLGEAVARMQGAGVRRLLVVSDEGQLMGFLSSDDLLDALAAQLAGLASALRTGIERETVERGEVEPLGARPVFLPHGTPGMPGAGTLG